ncbi:hypothetical protein CLV98_11529 [Dyadobacter jejuensis]|uniref:Uncharacterized protein n=1 Tax=Dyadobacter jejuensis TaxID=1082580 RepID=A0A316ADG8_9BACT|nr:hypothetical protein CLV98_11529 [Dyadobacter jejuensis]
MIALASFSFVIPKRMGELPCYFNNASNLCATNSDDAGF